jgi:DNA polymerase-3 subunit beta
MTHSNILLKTIDKRASIPALSTILVKDNKAYATDMDVLTFMPCNNNIEAGLYDAKEFNVGIYNKSNIDTASWPFLIVRDVKASVTIGAGALHNALSFVEHAISNEATRYYLWGVFFNVATGELVATDGHRLAKMTLSIEGLNYEGISSHGASNGFILPTKTVNLILAAKQKDNVKISLAETQITFEFDSGLTIRSKLIGGNFPDYNRVIPNAETKGSLTINAKTFKADYKKAKAIRINKLIILSAIGFNYGADSRLKTDCNTGFSDFGAGFNAKYIEDAINAVGGDLKLDYSDSAAPVKMVMAGGLLVIMPMRV